jgi:hypothetical protein
MIGRGEIMVKIKEIISIGDLQEEDQILVILSGEQEGTLQLALKSPHPLSYPLDKA